MKPLPSVLAPLVVFASLAARPALAQPAEPAKPALVIKADKGFIDDPFALDPDGPRLAFIRTDSASFARVDVVDLAAGKTTKAISVGDPQQLFDRLIFAPGGGVIVVTRESGTGARTAQHYGADSRPLGAAGPVADFATVSRGGKAYLVGWDRKAAASGDITYAVTQYQLHGLARVGKARTVTVGKDAMVKAPSIKAVSWQDGYAQLLGVLPAGFDKKKDMRQPERAALYDLLQGAVVWESEIGDVLGWLASVQLRRNRPNRGLIAVVSDEPQGVQLVDAMGRKWPVTLAAPFSQYDPRSLQEQEDTTRGLLHFSLTIDPLHPEALARRKADRSFLDVYRAQRAEGGKTAPSTVRVLRTHMDDRPVGWAVGAGHAAVLRRHKSFSRGGAELEVYAFPAPGK